MGRSQRQTNPRRSITLTCWFVDYCSANIVRCKEFSAHSPLVISVQVRGLVYFRTLQPKTARDTIILTIHWFRHNDLSLSLALSPPLLVRFIEDGADTAPVRLALLAMAFSVAYAWSAVFARRLGQKPENNQLNFAMLFTLMLPAPVGWIGALLATSFGWVFGREVFGGKAILSPALVALAFAIFSFPKGGYETQLILSAQPSLLLALSCLPGAVWLLWNGMLPWRIVVGAAAGAAATALLFAVPAAPSWWQHFVLGSFSIGILFLAAARESAPNTEKARWLYGVMVGALVITIRLANPDQPDGVVLAALLGGLFAPLLDRALSWRTHYE